MIGYRCKLFAHTCLNFIAHLYLQSINTYAAPYTGVAGATSSRAWCWVQCRVDQQALDVLPIGPHCLDVQAWTQEVCSSWGAKTRDKGQKSPTPHFFSSDFSHFISEIEEKAKYK